MNNEYDRDLIPVEGNSSLKRDNYSTAIINTDTGSYNSYLSQREKRIKEMQEIQNLKNDVSEIKKMLSVIMEKL